MLDSIIVGLPLGLSVIQVKRSLKYSSEQRMLEKMTCIDLQSMIEIIMMKGENNNGLQ